MKPAPRCASWCRRLSGAPGGSRRFWPRLFLGGGWAAYKTRRKRLAGKLKTAAELSKYGDQFGLSAREQEIILFVLAGKSNKEIENKLFIAESTVKNHIYSIYRKLDVKNRAQLVAFFKNLNKG